MDIKQLEQIKTQALDAGFLRAAIVDADMLDMSNAIEVREMCKVNYCGKYCKSWSCPPACGEIEACAANVAACSSGVLVQKVYQMEDSYDFEAAVEGQKDFNDIFMKLLDLLKAQYENLLPLGAGTCNLCPKCTYPDAPCRYPDKLFYSMESHGIVVSSLCKKCGVPYISGKDTVTYIGIYLFK